MGLIKVVRLRRAADEWGNYEVPVGQRKYVPFSRDGEPTTVPDLHARIGDDYKAVDYQLFDRNYIRWVRGPDVANLGKKPEKQFPSLSRIYSSKFHAARTAESLNSQRETVEFLLAEYERWPPGSNYSALRIEYPVHLNALRPTVDAGEKTVSTWMQQAFPNHFLQKRGVSSPAGLRRTWGAYAAHKLAPLDQQYTSELASILRDRGRALDREPDARAIARTIQPYVASVCAAPAMDKTLTDVYESALRRRGLHINGQRRLLQRLDTGSAP